MPTENKTEIVIFKTSDNTVSIDVRFEGETVWLTQAQLVDLYGSSKANVSIHTGFTMDKANGKLNLAQFSPTKFRFISRKS